MKREELQPLEIERKRINAMRTVEERDAHRHGTPARWIRQEERGTGL